MDFSQLFIILLFSNEKYIAKLLSQLDNKYLWKLLFIRDYQINKIIKSYYHFYILCHNIEKKATYYYIGTRRFFIMHIFHLYKTISMHRAFFGLKNISNEIYHNINLYILNISKNQLISIPSELCSCVNLNQLNISENKLKIIPTEIGKCINLNLIEINNNELYSVPTEIGNCVNLEYMYCGINNIINIPSEIGNCINLKQLCVIRNNIMNLPTEIGKWLI